MIDWGKELARMIGAGEQRVSCYKNLIRDAYKAGDRETIALLKPFQQDEEKNLKRLVEEKTDWNAGMWGMNFGKRR